MSGLRFMRVGLLVLGLHAASLLHAQKPLTSVRAIRELSPTAAAAGAPVELRGRVTAVSGWRNSFFFQDAELGISVNRDSPTPQVHAGDRVLLRGVTAPGSFAPIVQGSGVTVLGPAPPQKARLQTAEDLVGGRQDAQWIAIRGTVHSQRVAPLWGSNVLTLSVDIGFGFTVSVQIRDFDAAHVPALTGAYIQVDGVCGTIFNDRHQFVGVRLFTPGTAQVAVLRPAPADPFDRPAYALDSLLQFSRFNTFSDLVRVHGTVTWQKAGSGFYLQSTGKGLFVEWKEDTNPPVGAFVEAVGYPTIGHGSTRLTAAFVRTAGPGVHIAPKPARPADLIAMRDGFVVTPLENVLIQVNGRLVEIAPGLQQSTLFLQQDNTLFSVHVPSEAAANLSPGAELRLTGVCSVDYDDFSNAPTAFFLQVRTNKDVVVLRQAPWWNARHAIGVAEALAVAVAGLVLLLLLSRQATLRSLATTDPLTGLANRRTVLRSIERVRAASLRSGQTMLLLFIDVDHFKAINDSHGHRYGDLALIQVAAVLRAAFPQNAVLGRIGGDEFVVVMQKTSRTECESRLTAALERSNKSGALGVPVSLSLGALECGPDNRSATVDDLLERADMLMYKQKHTPAAQLLPARGLLTAGTRHVAATA